MASLLSVSNILWASQPLLEAMVAISLWRRKMHKEFPYFFAYLLAQIAMFCVLFPIYNWSTDVFFHRYWYYLDWGTTAVGIALGFRILHEISMDVFRPFHTLKDLGTVLFRWAALVMLLVGVVVAASATPNVLIIAQVVVAIQRCLLLAQMGLVLFLMMFASYLRMHWRHRSFGLALGFGLVATAEVLTYALMVNDKDFASRGVASLVLTLSYDLALAVWFTYCWIECPASMAETTRLKTQRWDRGLAEIHHPMPAESLIPMFEDMVERALARSSPMPPVEEATLTQRSAAGR